MLFICLRESRKINQERSIFFVATNECAGSDFKDHIEIAEKVHRKCMNAVDFIRGMIRKITETLYSRFLTI